MSRPALHTLLAVFALMAAWTPARAIDCTGTSTGLVPLIDLGAGSYFGHPGGLYPGGLNTRPAAHEAAGVAIASTIGPLDTLGRPDPAGRVVLISIGMSNCTQEFSTFVPKANADPMKSGNVRVIDCAQGGQAANLIRDPNAAYWDTVAARLRARGSSPLQAQAVWIKEANSGPTTGFPAATEDLMRNLGAIVRIIKDKLPNVRLAYLTSRIYAGYADTQLNPEPYAYESGFAVKWLIEAQIAGEDSLNWDPAAGPVESPWLSWGPYLWADGLSPRSDGLTWACSMFANDGTHPGPAARNLVADSLLAFMKRDATTRPWFARTPTAAAEPASAATIELAVGPVPARRGVGVTLAAPAGAAWRLAVFDAGGRRVRELGRGTGDGAAVRLEWDARDAAGVRAAAGIYWVRGEVGGRAIARRCVLLDGR